MIAPPEYSDAALAGERLPLTVIADAGTDAGRTASDAIQVAASRLQGAAETARLAAEEFRAAGGAPDAAFLAQAAEDALAAWRDPPVSVEVVAARGSEPVVESETADLSGFAQSSAGMMVQFAIAGLISAAEIMVVERKSGALRRLLTTAISRVEIIFGHYLAIFVLIFLQLVLLVGFGQVALGLPYVDAPGATLLVMVTMALWTASLGLLIGVLSQSEEQSIIFAMIPMFVLSALGGAWMPLEVTGETFQTIGHLTPTAWAMDGFKNIIVRGLGLESVLLPAGVMLAYALALFALAAWRFRFE